MADVLAWVKQHKTLSLRLSAIVLVVFAVLALILYFQTHLQVKDKLAALIISIAAIIAIIWFFVFRRAHRTPEAQAVYDKRMAELEAENDFSRRKNA